MPVRLGMWAALWASTLGAAAPAPEDKAPRNTPPPFLAVIQTPRPPTLDGRVSESEWRYATKTTGFLNLADGRFASSQTSFWLTYDALRLYAAFVCELPPEDLPRVTDTRRDGSIWTDDSVELLLLPPEGGPEHVVHFVGNSAGAVYDERGRDKTWDGRWKFRTESARGGWSAELSIPWEDLGTKAPTGRTWRGNIGRNSGAYTAWSDTLRGYNNPERFGQWKFLAEGAVVQLGPLEGLGTTAGAVTVRVFNASPKAAKLVLGVRAFGDSAKSPSAFPRLGGEEWPPARRPSLPPGGGLADFSLTIAAGPVGGGRRLLVGMDDEDGSPLLRQAIPYLSKAAEFVRLAADPAEEKIFVQADLRGFKKPEAIDLHLSLENTGKGWRKDIAFPSLPAGATRTLTEDIRDWPPGVCQVRARLSGAGRDKPLAETHLTYERIDPPDWLAKGRSVGVSREILKPWTPISWKDESLGVWGRGHDFQDSLLPAQIFSAGEPLLASPAVLEAACDGRACAAVLERRTTVSADPDRVVTRATGRLGPVPVELTATAEYDGMLKFELALQPTPGARLDRLRLRLPFRTDRAKYYHLSSSYYARGETGAVPPGGLRLPFHPFVWLGDDRRGLTWFAESTEGWAPGREPIRIQPGPRGESAELTVEFFDSPQAVASPRRIVFGLHATPVKPPPSDWRAWRDDHLVSRRLEKKLHVDWEGMGVPVQWRILWWTDGPKRIFSEGYCTPHQILPGLAPYVEKAHAAGTRVVTYYYLHGVSAIATGYDRYYPAWQTTSPREIAGEGDVIHGACPCCTYGDYMLLGFERMVKQYRVDGLYFDGGGPPVPCGNPLHGHGWIDAEGARQPVYPIFGLRDFFKRLATMLAQNVERPVIYVHSDGKLAPPVYSFITAIWEGEMIQGPLQQGSAYTSDLLSPEFCRAHLSATQWGIVPIWHPFNFGPPEQKLRQARDGLAWLLVHGTAIGKVNSFDRDLTEAAWKAQAAFGTDRAQFLGYWENADRVKLDPAHPRLLASLFERDGRRMVVLANLSDETRQAGITLNPPAPGPLRDAISGETLPASSGRHPCPIAPRAFRLLVD